MIDMIEYSFEECGLDLLKGRICNYIIKNGRKYIDQVFGIRSGNYFLRIKYNHHIYKVVIIKIENERYWYLKPYNKSCYTANARDYNSFELVIYVIKESDLIISKK